MGRDRFLAGMHCSTRTSLYHSLCCSYAWARWAPGVAGPGVLAGGAAIASRMLQVADRTHLADVAHCVEMYIGSF